MIFFIFPMIFVTEANKKLFIWWRWYGVADTHQKLQKATFKFTSWEKYVVGTYLVSAT